jgi:hypothetical protein
MDLAALAADQPGRQTSPPGPAVSAFRSRTIVTHEEQQQQWMDCSFNSSHRDTFGGVLDRSGAAHPQAAPRHFNGAFGRTVATTNTGGGEAMRETRNSAPALDEGGPASSQAPGVDNALLDRSASGGGGLALERVSETNSQMGDSHTTTTTTTTTTVKTVSVTRLGGSGSKAGSKAGSNNALDSSLSQSQSLAGFNLGAMDSSIPEGSAVDSGSQPMEMYVSADLAELSRSTSGLLAQSEAGSDKAPNAKANGDGTSALQFGLQASL